MSQSICWSTRRHLRKVLKISIREFRHLVDLSVIPFRPHGGRKKRLYYIEDLRAHAKTQPPLCPVSQPNRRIGIGGQRHVLSRAMTNTL